MTEKTVAAKLGIKLGTALWVSHPDRLALVGVLPAGATVAAAPREATVALVFADDAASVRAVLAAHRATFGAWPSARPIFTFISTPSTRRSLRALLWRRTQVRMSWLGGS